MGRDYVGPLGALVFQATRRLSDAQSARQTSQEQGEGTGNWHMEISDSASVLLDGNASGKLEQKSMRCRMPDARRCCTTTALLPASCVPAAAARTSKAVGSLRRHPSVAQHQSLGGFLDGPQSVSAHPSRAMQGQRPPERTGEGVRRC